MEITKHTDPDAFWALAAPLVRADPVRYSVLASVIDAVRRDPDAYPSHVFYAVTRPGRPPFLAHHTPPYPFHLPAADVEAAEALAELAHAQDAQPDGAGGEASSVLAFGTRWCRLTGQTQQVALRLGQYDLPGPAVLRWPVSGMARTADARDEPLVAEWMAAFHAELALPGLGAGGRLAIEDHRAVLWCDPDPVAMAVASVPAGGVSRIGFVYTPPGHRGHGYASAVTAAISERQRERGLRCMLYTDLANPTSNAIYAAIGYRRLGETLDVRFSG